MRYPEIDSYEAWGVVVLLCLLLWDFGVWVVVWVVFARFGLGYLVYIIAKVVDS